MWDTFFFFEFADEEVRLERVNDLHFGILESLAMQ